MSIAESDTVGAASLDLAASELLGVEPGVEPVVSEELGVRALLDNPAGLDSQDEVGTEGGGQAVGDRDRGAPLGGVLECLRTSRSLVVSSALVASSGIKMRGPLSNTLAMPGVVFCPPDSR